MDSVKYSHTEGWFLKGVLIVVFLILFARLIELQVIRGAYFRDLSEGNRIRRIPIVAPRGEILARGGEVIVGNQEVLRRLVFDLSGFKKDKDVGDASDEEIITEWVRDYKWGPPFAHITGYLGEASESEVGKVRAKCTEKGPIKLASLVGRMGLEERYDCILSGVDGEELIEVDSLGRKVRTLGTKEARSGGELRTTIDFGLQVKVSKLMDGKRGAVIATDISGEVLALYSSPSFDPRIFSSETKADPSVYFKDPDKPLFNRAIGGMFHPGSVYKPVVAIAALEEGTISKDFIFDDKGRIEIDTPYGDFSYNNWYFTQYGAVEGKIDVTKALARSTDTFFYTVGEMLGVDDLVYWSSRFGLDKETGIDIPGEIAGLVPSPSWKLRAKAERWFLGNTYHMAIGQGDIALTPIGIQMAISAIAANGEYCTPNVVKINGETAKSCGNLDISRESINIVKEGMIEACSVGGTGFTFFDFSQKHPGITVACKTGTAENISEDSHAWFTVFAPHDNPKIVLTVLVENGGEGSKVAGPIAREIFDYWFDKLP